jgi:hypothetical protein
MDQGDGMLRLELIFLHSANGGGCFRWRGEDSTYLQSEPDAPLSEQILARSR